MAFCNWLLPNVFYFPGLGTIAGLILVFLVGLLMKAVLIRQLFSLSEGLLYRLPIVKSIYSAIRDLIDFFSPKKEQFGRVVIVTVNGMEMIGFITQEDPERLPESFRNADSVLVYLPMSYMIGGFTLLIPKQDIRPCQMNMDEAMRFVLTAGITGKSNGTGDTTETQMKAMVLERPGQPLQLVQRPEPLPGPGQVQVAVSACGVCRTDLHVVDGDLDDARLPIIPGHEIVGRVTMLGTGVDHFDIGERVGIPWLGATCGCCRYCASGDENLCDTPGFTGYQIDGGYAEMTVADARFCFPLPGPQGDAETAPWLCAGLIGYRSLLMTGDTGERLGIYGFGAAAHIVTQLARHQGREVYAFTSPGDTTAQAFAREMGCCWAGDSTQSAPVELDAAIIFAPVGALIPAALRAVRKAGIVVCGGIYMSDDSELCLRPAVG